MKITAIIVAAGRGQRAGGGLPKQFRDLLGRPVLAHTVDAFRRHPRVGAIVVVTHPDDRERAGPACGEAIFAEGRETRAGSVAAGLAAVPDGTTHVLIHDAARPCVSQALIDRVVGALDRARGAAPALAVTDALWRSHAGSVAAVVPREGLARAQTPQGFALDAIRQAHEGADPDAADDVAVALAAGMRVAIVAGDEANLKITMPEDFARAAAVLGGPPDIRTGTGFDVHRFAPGDHVTLCGVRVAHDARLSGHSDADVAMHALTDAIYGALADGDIGQHFPPTDPQWKGAPSDIFLRHAVERARSRGFRITHLDCTIICEAPRIGPHADEMKDSLARITGIAADRISVKATTTETLGFAGRKEGIAAQASATLVKP